MNLKRLWDTENKKIVWAIPTGDPHTKLQVWTNDDGSKLYVYTGSAFRELSLASATVSEYGPVWKALDDETVGYYLTNVPTDLYNWDEGDEVAYRFMNGTTVLQSGKVDEGETPEYTGDTPTKSATAQYTYTFSGWKPTVGPIYKKTDFKTQFDSTVNEYTVSIASNDIDYGTVDESSVTDIPYGTKLSTEDNVLTIGEGTSAVEVTATAESGYVFSSWGEVPATVTGAITITATFEAEPAPSITLNSGEIPEGWAIEDGKGTVLSRPYNLIIENETVDAYTTMDGSALRIEDGDKTYTFSSTDEEDAPAYTHAWAYNGNTIPDIDDEGYDGPLTLNAGAEILCTWTPDE